MISITMTTADSQLLIDNCSSQTTADRQLLAAIVIFTDRIIRWVDRKFTQEQFIFLSFCFFSSILQGNIFLFPHNPSMFVYWG